MKKRHFSRSSVRTENLVPGHEAKGWRICTLVLLLAGVLGMVFLFGGTRFWSSTPFLFLILSTLSAYQIFNFRKAVETGRSIQVPPGTLVWGCVIIYAVIRAIGSPVPYETWTEAYLLTCGLLLYIVFADLGSQRGSQTWLCFLVLGAAVVQSMMALSLHWHESTQVLWLTRPAQYGMRASGSFICPNHFAHFLQMAIIMAFALMRSPSCRLPLRLFAGYTLLLALPSLLLTLSRAGWIGTLCGLGIVAVLFALRKSWKRAVGVSIGLILGIPLLTLLLLKVYPPVQTRINERTLQDIRITQIWPDTWNMIEGEGFWGAGPGTYAQVFEQYRENFSSMNLYLLYAHNDYLHTLAEYGWLVTLLIFGVLLWMLMNWMGKAVHTSPDRGALIPIVMAGILGGTMAHAVFDFNLHITGNALLLICLLAAWHGQGSCQNLWKRSLLPAGAGRAIILGSAILGLGLLWPTVRLGMGSYHEYQMREAAEASQSEVANAHAASMRRWTPSNWRGWTRLGETNRNQAFWMREPEEKARLIEASRQAYETAIRWNAFERDALFGLIELAKMEGREEEALQLFEELEKISPFDQQLQIRKGLTLRGLGRYEEALDVFEILVIEERISTKQIQLNIRQLKGLIRESRDQDLN
jgi:O-antigen ligase